MITLIIYLSIISYIIVKGFYKTIKSINNNQKIKLFYDSISIDSIPFFINMQKINLLCIFINLILISFIFLPNLVNDLIFSISNNNIAYCQDSNSDEEFSSDDDYVWGMPININSGESSSGDETWTNWRPLQQLPLNNNPSYYQDTVEEDIYENYSYEGILNKLINKTYKISNINRTFIYNINYKSIGINDHLMVFQGLSQNLEDIFNKQNTLLQKTSSINEDLDRVTNTSKMYSYIKLNIKCL